MHRASLTVLNVIILAVVAASCVTAQDLPESVTFWRMREIRRAIREFQISHGRLPADLGGICPRATPCPLMPGGSELADAWGEPFSYEAADSGDYVLRSGGPDHRLNTADDLVFASAVERAAVAEVSGCYRIDVGWWKEFPRLPLILDSTEVGVGRYGVRPTPEGYSSGTWILRGSDTIEVTWSLGEVVSKLWLRPPDSLLFGEAEVVGHRRRQISGRKVPC